ncbi:MAG: autotransporter assembly complex protein TamA [Erythrobacter sp.]
MIVATSLGSGVPGSAAVAGLTAPLALQLAGEAVGSPPPAGSARAEIETPQDQPVSRATDMAEADAADASDDTSSNAGEPADSPNADAPSPPVQPVPRTLDELIPAEAISDSQSWALGGAPRRRDPAPEPLAALPPAAAVLDGGDDPTEAALLALEDFAAPEAVASASEIGRQLDGFELALPEPLEADAEGEAFALLAIPELEQVVELAEFPLNDTITLAFPADPEAFPEREEVTARFRALSALAQLERGEDTAPQIAARARADADLLTQILGTYGYYGGEVVRQLSGGRRARENGAVAGNAAAETAVRFDIYPGMQYRFGAIDLGALERLPDDERSALRGAFAIAVGDPLLADRIMAERGALGAALGENGYPFAQMGEPELLIDHARQEGDLALPVDPGGRYVFAGLTSGDPDFLPARHLARIARFRPGELYRESLEVDLRRAILATGLVSSVTLTPRESEPPQGDAPGEVMIDVAFERAPLRTLTGGIGYGTEDGFKAEATWEHRNLFPPEGALRLRGIVGTREFLGNIGFKRNNFMGRDQVLFFDLFASDITTVAVESRTLGLRGTFERLSNFIYQKEFSWQVGAEALVTEERNRTVRIAPGAIGPRRAFTIAGLFGSATIDQSDDLLDPTKGYRATLFLAPESSRSEGVQDFYLRAQLDAAAYRLVGERTVLAGRVRAATIQGADLANVAPSRRLYGGGGASVRGYGFQGVGPRDAAGQATGGAALLEASVEARITTPLLDGAVQVVPFFDIGSVSQRSVPNFDFIRYAAGLGVRYKTSFGPIRIDVGVPLNRSEFDAPVVVFIGIGQAF